jgi:LPS sulfotransferase NodH
MSYLNSHPNIHTDGEVFQRLDGRDYRNILDTVFAKQSFRTRAKGFKLFYYHPLDERSKALWTDLAGMTSLRIIHLKRRNTLRTIVSKKIAMEQGIWFLPETNRTDTSCTPKKVHMSVEDVRKELEQTKAWEQEADRLFRNHPGLSILYEDLVENPERTLLSVTNFLGVRPVVCPYSHYTKQNPEPLRDLIQNYDELENAFSGTQWQIYFSDF